jgi:hypothetical protein
MKTYYLTKYALTKGILEIQSDETTDENNLITYGNEWQYAHLKQDIFETKEEAIAKAELIRLDKIKKLEKKLSKLNKMSFS